MSIWKEMKRVEKELKALEKRIARKESKLKARGIKIDYSSIKKPEFDKRPEGQNKKQSIWDTLDGVREALNAKKKYLESLEKKCDEELAKMYL